ncbi:hypothetical protein [Methanobrevibacter sp.]|uniref:hypothetical protein n=1 Tax=Methanobrevibacter sp. TaxID=66852 RepID=UPI00388DE01F
MDCGDGFEIKDTCPTGHAQTEGTGRQIRPEKNLRQPAESYKHQKKPKKSYINGNFQFKGR